MCMEILSRAADLADEGGYNSSTWKFVFQLGLCGCGKFLMVQDALVQVGDSMGKVHLLLCYK